MKTNKNQDEWNTGMVATSVAVVAVLALAVSVAIVVRSFVGVLKGAKCH